MANSSLTRLSSWLNIAQAKGESSKLESGSNGGEFNGWFESESDPQVLVCMEGGVFVSLTDVTNVSGPIEVGLESVTSLASNPG